MKLSKWFYKLCSFFLRGFYRLRFNPKVIGKENIPKKGKAIFVANHISNYDFLSMAVVTKRQVHFMAKSSLFKGPLKFIMCGVKAIPVDRKHKNPRAIKDALNYLEQGEIVGIFPEGTTSNDNQLREFKMGAIKLAVESNSVIVPITIRGSYKRNNLEIIVDQPFALQSSDKAFENKKLRNIIEKNLRGKYEFSELDEK